MADKTVRLRLTLDDSDLEHKLQGARAAMAGLGHGAQSAFSGVGRGLDYLSAKMSGLHSAIIALGGGIGGMQLTKQYMDMDLLFTRMALTAGVANQAIMPLRDTIYGLANRNNVKRDDLAQAAYMLVQAGHSIGQVQASMQSIAQATAVTGTSTLTLAEGISATSNAFQINLEKAGAAKKMLDEFTVAGYRGNLNLENLSAAVGKVGAIAAGSGIQVHEMLGLLEAASLIEQDPNLLGTYMRGTLRIFQDYKDKVALAKSVGAQAYDPKTGREGISNFELLIKLIDKYNNGFKGNDAARAVWYSKTPMGKDMRSGEGFEFLTKIPIEKIRSLIAEIQKGGALTAGNVATANERASAEWETLKNNITDVRKAMDPLLGRMETLLKFLNAHPSGLRTALYGTAGALVALMVASKGYALVKDIIGLVGAVRGKRDVLTGLPAGFGGGAGLGGVQNVYVVNMPGAGPSMANPGGWTGQPAPGMPRGPAGPAPGPLAGQGAGWRQMLGGAAGALVGIGSMESILKAGRYGSAGHNVAVGAGAGFAGATSAAATGALLGGGPMGALVAEIGWATYSIGKTSLLAGQLSLENGRAWMAQRKAQLGEQALGERVARKYGIRIQGGSPEANNVLAAALTAVRQGKGWEGASDAIKAGVRGGSISASESLAIREALRAAGITKGESGPEAAKRLDEIRALLAQKPGLSVTIQLGENGEASVTGMEGLDHPSIQVLRLHGGGAPKTR